MKRSIFRLSLALVFLYLVFGASLHAEAQNTPVTGITQIAGVVVDSQQRPVGDAQVRLSGPVSESISTTSDGSFAFVNLPSGIYRLDIAKGGFNTETQNDIVTTAGSTTRLSFTLQAASLTSLTIIGNVSVNARNSANTINTTPASIVDVPATTFTDQGQLSVNQVLNEEPGVTIGLNGCDNGFIMDNGANSAQTGIPSVRGGLPYETESLVDGHPLSLGQNGFYNPSFLSPYLLQNVEVVKGPGATSPSINYAINGTINYRTLEPTLKPQESVDFGEDQYGGNFANFRLTGTLPNGHLSYAFDYFTKGTLGFQRGLTEPSIFYPCAPVYLNGTRINPFGGFGVVSHSSEGLYGESSDLVDSFVLDGNDSITNEQYANQRNELGKIRYAFTPSTVLTLTYVGGQSAAASMGGYAQPLQEAVFAPPAGYSGSIPAGQNGVNGIFEGFEYNSQQVIDSNLFETEFHMPLGKTATLLLRQYSSSIQCFLGGPGDSGPTAAPTTTLDTGVFGAVYYGASNYTTPTIFNGQVATFTYNFYWENRSYNDLNGYTAEIDKQAGNDLLTLSYDEEKTSTLATKINCLGDASVVVPGGSSQTFRSIMGRAQFDLGPNLNGTLSDNFGSYTDVFSQDGGVTFLSSTHTYQAPRLSMTWRPNANQAVRGSVGFSIAPPYLGLLNNTTTITPVGTPPSYWTETGNSGDVLPETALGFDLGLDTRLHSPYTVLSVDLYQTLLHNQFLTATTPEGTFTCSSAAVCGADYIYYPVLDNTTAPLYVTEARNLGHSEYEGVEVSLHRTPPTGWGYRIQGSLMRAFAYDLPAGFYNTPTGPDTTNLGVLPDINFQGEGSCGWSGMGFSRIPYSMGYGEINFRGRNGAYFLLGLTYYGPNNPYDEPAFGVVTTSFMLPVTKRTSLQLSIYNLTNAYPSLFPFSPHTFQKGAILTPLVNGEVGSITENVIGPSIARLTLHVDL